jgi:hypothetical protein
MAPPQSTSIPKKTLSPKQAIIIGEGDIFAACLANAPIVSAYWTGVLPVDKIERELSRPASSIGGERQLTAVVHDEDLKTPGRLERVEAGFCDLRTIGGGYDMMAAPAAHEA